MNEYPLVTKLEGKELQDFLLALNEFHLELHVLELAVGVPDIVKHAAKIIRERHEEIMIKHKVSY